MKLPNHRQLKPGTILPAKRNRRYDRHHVGYLRLAAAIGLTWLDCFDRPQAGEAQ